MASAMSLMIKQHIYIYLKVQFLGRCQIVQSAKDKKQKISLPKKRVRKVTIHTEGRFWHGLCGSIFLPCRCKRNGKEQKFRHKFSEAH
jgi:hypothetical protein